MTQNSLITSTNSTQNSTISSKFAIPDPIKFILDKDKLSTTSYGYSGNGTKEIRIQSANSPLSPLSHTKVPSPSSPSTYVPAKKIKITNSPSTQAAPSSGQTFAKAKNIKAIVPRPQNTHGRCSHLESFKLSPKFQHYIKIHQYLVFPKGHKQIAYKNQQARCFKCNTSIGLHVCMTCPYVSCIKDGHFREHFLSTNHGLACNLDNGYVYCFNCSDTFMDPDFTSQFPSSSSSSLNVQRKSLAAQAYRSCFQDFSATSSKSIVGLRGLINLGHTCFMSSIVQAFTHTPILDSFFLSKKIECNEKHDLKKQKPCIASLVSGLYHDFYKGEKAPMSLHDLLCRIWRNAAHLAGYEQQDAHEFFIAMLDALHLHFHSPNEEGICNCIIDTIFLGKLESAVTCCICGQKSITVDPFWDTSLDLMTDDPTVTLTLADCLTRYTRIEYLGSSSKIFCNMCKNNQESTKQLKFKSLPLVLCLHLKRFELKPSCKKIDTRVEFPEELYMHPYTSEFSGTEHSMNDECILEDRMQETKYKYTLYAVVNHVGSIEGGHYYAYIKHAEGTWYKCDDLHVTVVDEEEVLASVGYLLFYHQSTLFTKQKSNVKTLNTSMT